MKLRAEQLTAHLDKSLAPLYIVSGSEPLLMQESCDAIRAKARALGFSERKVMHVDKKFDWASLSGALNEMSLFCDKQLIELLMPTGKPGQAGAKVLKAIAQDLPADKLLMVVTEKLDAGTQKSVWFKTLESAGTFIQIWPVSDEQMPRWLQSRLQNRGLSTDNMGIQLLSERVAGNLLAANQEIEKLLLLHGPGKITADDIADAVSNSSRYDVFALVDAALRGDGKRVVRILDVLQGEGTEAILVLWALARECRALANIAYGQARGDDLSSLYRQNQIWQTRIPPIQQALKRHSIPSLQFMLRQARQLDELVKGARKGNPWLALRDLSLMLAGIRIITGIKKRVSHA